jgi:4-amino-4-deoxy-L-arabinose transferase-like glycosyltransferase
MAVQRSQQLLLILFVSGLCFFTRLGSPRLWDRDEPRNARCACEMVERHDWVVPTFNGELRAHKPILLYWLMMSAYWLFGINEFAARFWSAALACGTALLTYQIGCRLFDARSATWAAVILATTLMFNVAAHAATPDSALIFCTTLAMALFVRSGWAPSGCVTSPHEPNRRFDPASIASLDRRWIAGAGLAMGAGVLAKGPVGFVLPATVWTLFLWIFAARACRDKPLSEPVAERPTSSIRRGRFSRWLVRWLVPRLEIGHLQPSLRAWHPLTAIGAMLAIALPWYVLVGLRTEGAWLREFFLEHNVGRVMSPMEGHGGNALLFYPVSILVGFFPWSALTVPAAIWVAARRNSRGYDSRFGLLLVWVATYVVVFSLAGTKLPSYVTPTYPALALMVGHFVAHWPTSVASPARWWLRWSAGTLVIVGLTLSVGLPWAAHHYLPQEERIGAIGVVLLVGGAACGMSFRRDQLTVGMRRLALTSLCFIVVLYGWVAPRVGRHQRIEQLLATARQLDPSAPLASWEVHEPSWVFYAGRTVPRLSDSTPQAVIDVLNRQQGFLITRGTRYERLRELVGHQATIVDEIPYFLRNDDLLLISATGPVTARPTRTSPH